MVCHGHAEGAEKPLRGEETPSSEELGTSMERTQPEAAPSGRISPWKGLSSTGTAQGGEGGPAEGLSVLCSDELRVAHCTLRFRRFQPKQLHDSTHNWEMLLQPRLHSPCYTADGTAGSYLWHSVHAGSNCGKF